MKQGTEHAFRERLGQQKRFVCEKDGGKKEGSHWPPGIMEKDPAKPVSGKKRTESKPRKKIKGGSTSKW